MGLSVFPARAQVPIHKDWERKTHITPKWFGPNAFPVPEMVSGPLCTALSLDLAGDYFRGSLVPGAKDDTYDAFIRLHIPLNPGRVALSIWMPVVEWWNYAPGVAEERRVEDGVVHNGHDSGDVYVSTEIALLQEGPLFPSLTVRSVLKTASGNTYEQARYYDAPGYFFDLTAGKTLPGNLQVSASSGFLCWQTDNGRQNDAVMWGIRTDWIRGGFSILAQVSGYSGWEREGDAPVAAMGSVVFPSLLSCASPFISLTAGLRDYPFTQVRCGVRLVVRK